MPVAVAGVTTAVDLDAGGIHSCAAKTDGTAYCWGANGRGQLGDGTTSGRLLPVRVAGVTGAVAITTGAYHSCALNASGGERCWGMTFA